MAPGVWQMLPSVAMPPKTDLYSTTLTWDGEEAVLMGRLTSAHVYGRSVDFTYYPQDDRWWRLPAFPGPKGGFEGTDNAVWDGTEPIVWGITDGAYRPANHRWRALPPGGFGGGSDVAVWTGHQTLGFGGGCCDGQTQMYASYTPSTNSWSVPPNGPLPGRHGPVAVWTGHEFIVAGGSTTYPAPGGEKIVIIAMRPRTTPARRPGGSFLRCRWPVTAGRRSGTATR